MKKNLTHASVAALKSPPGGQVDYWDTRKPGFGIRVSKGGTKTWLLMYRQHGRKHRLALGRFPDMSVADARTQATSRLGDIVKGADPAQERAQAKSDPTFGELADLYLERHARVKKKPRSVAEDVYMLNADLLPAWKDRKLPAIRRRDVIALLDGIVDRGSPIHANRVRALCSTIFNFAIGRDLIEYNPAHRVPRPAPEKSRERKLTDDEIRELWKALEPEPAKVRAVYILALLTAARKSELLNLAWSELDLDRSLWTLPATRSKTGQEHLIPLSPTAVTLLRSLPVDSRSEFVFTGGRIGRAVANPQKWIVRIRERAKLVDFRFHDLRRTAASGMTAIGVDRLTVSKILNHAEGGVTKVYDRHSYDKEKRAAIIKWDRHLQRLLTGGEKTKVVQLHA